MDLLHKATELYDRGFAVIPTKRNKAPIATGWQTMVGDNRAAPNGNFQDPIASGIGVICGHPHGEGYLACLDVDCYDNDISRHMCAFIMDRLGDFYPMRVGQRPKFAIPVLMSEPWRKVTSNTYGNSRIEVLGLGQQFVAYGAHPKAKKGQYAWFNGELTSDLPTLDVRDLWSIIAEFEIVCENSGMVLTLDGTRQQADTQPVDDLEAIINNRPLGISDQQVKDTLRNYTAQGLSHDHWCQVGMALYHQYEGSDAGYTLWNRWSQQDADRYDANTMRARWDSFSGRDRPITMASILKRAKQTFVKHEGGYLNLGGGNRLGKGSHVEWLIQGIVEAATIGQIFAPPKVGKTFFALDMAAHLAAGVEWNGRKVVGGPVVFLAGEGEGGINRRLAALEKEKGLDTSNLIISKMPNFGDTAALQSLLLEMQAMPIPPVMMVVDTLARATAGLEENSSKDMGPIMEAMATFTRKIRCAVMAIHHTAKASGAEGRGSGAIKGAMDFEIRLESGGDGVVVVSCAKSKDAEPFDDMAFRLDNVPLPSNHTDNFGGEVSSAVIEWLDVVPETTRPLTDNMKGVVMAHDALWLDSAMHMTTPTAILKQHGLNSPAVGVSVDAARDYYVNAQPDLNTATRNTLTGRYRDAVKALSSRGVMAVYDGILVKL